MHRIEWNWAVSMCRCTVCTDGTVAMTSKQSRLTELTRQEALRVVALLCREANWNWWWIWSHWNKLCRLWLACGFFILLHELHNRKLGLPLLCMLAPKSDSYLGVFKLNTVQIFEATWLFKISAKTWVKQMWDKNRVHVTNKLHRKNWSNC